MVNIILTLLYCIFWNKSHEMFVLIKNMYLAFERFQLNSIFHILKVVSVIWRNFLVSFHLANIITHFLFSLNLWNGNMMNQKWYNEKFTSKNTFVIKLLIFSLWDSPVVDNIRLSFSENLAATMPMSVVKVVVNLKIELIN